MPLITIIVPVYNVEEYLPACLQSILQQSYTNLEILVVDDGSQDHSSHICDDFAAKDQRMKVIHQANHGVSYARNVALKLASGEYIGFVDGDDWISNDMFEYLYSNMKANHADISICPHYSVKAGKKEVSLSYKEPLVLNNVECVRLLGKRDYLHDFAWDKLYKRELWENMFFPEGRIFEDVALIYKILYRADKIVLTNEPKYYYRTRSGSITANKYAAEKEYQILLAFHEQCLFGIEKNIWDNIPLKPFRTCVHLINHITAAESSAKNDEYYIKVLDTMHQYDFLKLKEIGFSMALKRFLIYHCYPFYKFCYRGFKRISRKG